jgi:hypothetical protein
MVQTAERVKAKGRLTVRVTGRVQVYACNPTS